ncbi:MAG: hypothetical protein LBK52_01960, partial [Deltaproteobacteria bacterium]|nr:hypothetical protein [Deltaproteobacteria bacterium]
MKKANLALYCLMFCLAGSLLSAGSARSAMVAVAAGPDKTLYQTSPFMSAYRTIPRVLLVLSKDRKMFQQAYNGLIDIDGDGRIDTGFNPKAIYYGYFDSYSCYTYAGSVSRAGDPNGYFKRSGPTMEDEAQSALDSKKDSILGAGSQLVIAGRSATGICNNPHTTQAGNFSGNWLNFLTASRIDVIRKILYGGARAVDTAAETVLAGSFVPRDSNSWGAEVLSDDRWLSETPTSVFFDISKYTPFPKPTSKTAHYFARVKNTTGTNTLNYPVFEYILNAKANTFTGITITQPYGRYFDWVLQEGPNPSSGNIVNNANVIRAYGVRVRVCENGNVGPGEDCRKYPNGALKPVGLLQKNGENGDMYFGLLTGTYSDNSRNKGGVLRNHIDHLANSVDLQTGQILNKGLIWSLDTFQIAGFELRGNTDASGGQKYVNSSSWGNPIGEMLYEGVRYFGRLGPKPSLTPTNDFIVDAEYAYNKNVAARITNWNTLPKLPAGECSKPIILLISEEESESDADTAIQNGTGGLDNAVISSIKEPGSLPAFNMNAYLKQITLNEGYNNGQKYFYSTGKTSNCLPKTLTSLESVRGICPYQPGWEGSYSSAAVAYFAHTHNFGAGDQEQNLDIYSVTMSTSFPNLDFPITDAAGNVLKKITILPTSMSNGSPAYTTGRLLSFLNYYIMEWWVDSKGMPYHVKIKVNYEDASVGYEPDNPGWPNTDWDMDVMI